MPFTMLRLNLKCACGNRDDMDVRVHLPPCSRHPDCKATMHIESAVELDPPDFIRPRGVEGERPQVVNDLDVVDDD